MSMMPGGPHDGDVVFGVSADDRDLDRSIKRVTESIETESKKWVQAGNSGANALTGAFESLFKKIAAGFTAHKIGQAVLDFGKQAVSAATELQNAQKSLDATFGRSGAVEQWASDAAENFGLTEAKAKSCLSEMGNLLNSAGIAGDALADMSTDLTGLAADMAEFYGTDFESAFQRIKQGVNGMTEPLKQFGINMSKANLEAFALSKGVTKTFDEMSQGEQTMLRYQYLLQETADAQGAFAASSDDYTAGLAKLEAGMANLTASIGALLVPALSSAVEWLNTLFDKLTSKPQRTVLDDFEDIEVDKNNQLGKIEEKYQKAQDLIAILQSLADAEVKENPGLVSFVTTLDGKLDDLDGAIKLAKQGDYEGTLREIANSLELKTGVSSVKWSTLLEAIGNKLPAASRAAGDDAGEGGSKTAAFLKAAGDAAAELGPEYAGYWDEFLNVLGAEAAGNALIHLAAGKAAADALGSLGLNANSLQWGTGTKWAALMATLNTIEPTKGLFGSDAATAAETVKNIAEGLSSNDPSKMSDAWSTMLGILSENAEGLSVLTGKSPEDTKKWLEDLAAAAEKIDSNDAVAWQNLLGALLDGLPGLANTELGASLLLQLGQLKTTTNGLYASSYKNWENLLNTLNDSTKVTGGIFGEDAAQKITSFAGALAEGNPSEKKAAWEELLGVFTAHKDDIATFTGQSVADVEKWLEELNKATPKIGDNLKEWDELFSSLVGHLSGTTNTNPINKQFLDNMEQVAGKSNLLNANSGQNWTNLLTALNNADATKGIFGTDAGTKISEMATALTSTDPSVKKQEWENILGVLSANAEGVSKLTGKPVGEITKYFEDLAKAIPETGDNLNAWNELFTSLVGNLANLNGDTGLSDDFLQNLETIKSTLSADGASGSQDFFALLMRGFSLLEYSAVDAEEALKTLGVNTDGVADKNALWLRTCKELVDTIPGLNSVINAETGEIKGSIGAIKEYVDDWRQGQEELLLWKAHYAKKEALLTNTDLVESNLEVGRTEAAMLRLWTALDAGTASQKEYNDAAEAYEKALDRNTQVVGDLQTAQQELNDEEQWLNEHTSAQSREMAKAALETDNAAASTAELAAQEKELQDALAKTTSALQEVENYYKKVADTIDSTLSRVAGGFTNVMTPAQKAKAEVESLQAELAKLKSDNKDNKNGSRIEDLNKKMTDLRAEVPTVTNMFTALVSQTTYMDDYLDKLEKVKKYTGASGKKIDGSLLAMLADGSAESLDYLNAIVDAIGTSGQSSDEVDALIDEWNKVQEQKKKLGETLTDTTLSVDEEFKKLTDAATKAIEELNQKSNAQKSMEDTVQGIADGITAKTDAVKTAVNGLIAQLERLNEYGKFGYSKGQLTYGGDVSGLLNVEGSFATGLGYVPYDNYLAALHEGEAVLTREEAKLWRTFSARASVAPNAVDYDSLGGIIRDNSKSGGDVYLNGEKVGRIMSAAQADSYRRLERSGYRG